MLFAGNLALNNKVYPEPYSEQNLAKVILWIFREQIPDFLPID